MLNEKKNIIEDYLDGNMSEKELKNFENAIEKDTQLANEVALVKEINQTISQEAQFKAFKAQLSSLNDLYFPKEEEEEEEPVQKAVVRQLPNSRRKWLYAASILIIAVSSFFIWNMLNSTMDAQELFASHYEPYGLGQRSSNDNSNEIEQQASEAYNNNNFEQAIPLFEKLIEMTPSNEKNILRLGSAYLSTNQPQQSINLFQKIIINPQSTLVQTAQWYKALAYLQLNNTIEAKKVLNTLANSGNRTYPAQAKKLLKSLK